MLPILAALGGGLLPVLISIIALVVLLGGLKAYDPAGDVYASVVKSTSFLKTPADGVERLILDFTPDDEYPAGGYTSLGLLAHATGSLAALQLTEIHHVEASGPGGYVWVWDRANGKLKAFQQTDPADAGGADVPLTEVTAGEDLSAEEVTVVVYGTRDYSNPS